MIERSKQFRWISVIMLILTGAAVPANIWCLTISESVVLIKTVSVLSILACLAALYYGLSGYRKNAASSYKLYMILYALALLMCTINRGFYLEGTLSAVTIGCMAVQFACIAIIIVAENLGEKKSLILCGIVAAFSVAAFVVCLFMSPGFLRGGGVSGTVAVIRSGSNNHLAFLTLTLTVAKYKDKDLRGTK